MIEFSFKTALFWGIYILLTFTPLEILSQDIPCGTIIDAVFNEISTPVQGQLIYKPGVNYEANERCVWIIRSHKSEIDHPSKMEFRLDQGEFETGDKVIVEFFTYQATASGDPRIHSLHLGKLSVGVPYENEGDVAIITFATERSLGKGFILSYQISPPVCEGVCHDVQFTDAINAESQGTITQRNETMGNYMLSTYVFPPDNFTYSESKKLISLSYTLIEQCSACCDALWVYAFNPIVGLLQIDEICGNLPSGLVFTVGDIIVLVFKSNGDTPSEGFELTWELEY